MAQDLTANRPDAVFLENAGFFTVDYAALGTRLIHWEEWLTQSAANVGPVRTVRCRLLVL